MSSHAEEVQNEFTVVYALEDPPESYAQSIFLAGPTPRSNDVESWRPLALLMLKNRGYKGAVFVPETRGGGFHGDYIGQVDWEERCLEMADCILFWVPRDMVTMPGLTTNVEFGRYENSGKIVLGAPDGAPHINYLFHHGNKLSAPVCTNLEDTVNVAINMVVDGAQRTGGEREVPLHIWHTPAFQQWYANLRVAGNVLEHAKQEYCFRVGPDKSIVFLWILHVEIFITSEGRSKTNEFVMARPDISTVVMYKRAQNIWDTQVVLVREFRSPVANVFGMVWELPGGSSFKPGGNPTQLAADEVAEETGLRLPEFRFHVHESRQLVATLSAHRAQLFSVAITDAEIEQLKATAGMPHGVEADSERTYVEVVTLGEIRQHRLVDWSMLGMILQVLAPV